MKNLSKLVLTLLSVTLLSVSSLNAQFNKNNAAYAVFYNDVVNNNDYTVSTNYYENKSKYSIIPTKVKLNTNNNKINTTHLSAFSNNRISVFEEYNFDNIFTSQYIFEGKHIGVLFESPKKQVSKSKVENITPNYVFKGKYIGSVF